MLLCALSLNQPVLSVPRPKARRPLSVIPTKRMPPCSLHTRSSVFTNRRRRSFRRKFTLRQYGVRRRQSSAHRSAFVSFAYVIGHPLERSAVPYLAIDAVGFAPA